MSTDYNFTLTKKASRSGGDKYTEEDMDWVAYFPQVITRDTNGQPRDTITLTVLDDDDIVNTDITEFSLKKAAKSQGGDRYTTEDHGGFDLYIPQAVSRGDSEGVPRKVFRVFIL